MLNVIVFYNELYDYVPKFLIKRRNQSNSVSLETSRGNVSIFREKINEVIYIHIFIGCVLLAPVFILLCFITAQCLKKTH